VIGRWDVIGRFGGQRCSGNRDGFGGDGILILCGDGRV